MQARIPARSRPASNLEPYGWLFMRISAIILFAMASFHLFYMHLVLGVDAINFQVIAQRWESPGWRLYDLILLLFGWIHGANGIRGILEDYIHAQDRKVLAQSILYVFVFVLIVLGSYVILTFKP